MTYATIFAKKNRMCARFGHLSPAWGRYSLYYCRRCGSTVSTTTRREVSP